MTKGELKAIIRECLIEREREEIENLVEAADEKERAIEEKINSIIESCNNDNINIENLIQEGTNTDNIKDFIECFKLAKKTIKEAKSLIREDKNKEAIKKIDSAIDELKKTQKIVVKNHGSYGTFIKGNILYILVGMIPAIISVAIANISRDKLVKDAEKKGIIKVLSKNFLTGDIEFEYKSLNILGISTVPVEIENLSKDCDTINAAASTVSLLISFIRGLKTLKEQHDYVAKYNKVNPNIVNVKIDKMIDYLISSLESQKLALKKKNS